MSSTFDEIDTESSRHILRTSEQQRRIDGAPQTYTEIWTRTEGRPRDPEPIFVEPEIHRGVRDLECKILPPVVEGIESEVPATQPIFLMRQDEPQFAYLNTKKVMKEIDHRGKGWGTIFMGLMLHPASSKETTNTKATTTRQLGEKSVSSDAAENGLYDSFSNCSTATATITSTDTYGDFCKSRYCFQMPTEDEAEYVSIKILNKEIVHKYLEKGGHENPYNEIACMQELGDDIHVLSCVEVLEDDQFLYIITPYCEDGSLMENIPWAASQADDSVPPGYPEAEARRLFKQILKILEYLNHNGICHHDLSPSNLMFYKGRLLLIDFAMSFRIPREDSGERYLVKGQGTYGTLAYLAPEVYVGYASFDGTYADIWSAAMILYNMLTGYQLCNLPCPIDINFKYFIIACGLKRDNKQAVDIFRETFRRQDNGQILRTGLFQRVMANMSISENAKDLLQHLLALNPHNRWSLQQTLDSPWVKTGET